MRRTLWQLTAIAVLFVVLATMATLQYRWLGEVSDAERDRMHASLRTRTAEFTEEFDDELTRAYMAFQVDPIALDADADRAFADAYRRWQTSAQAPGMVRSVYLLDVPADGAASLRRFDPALGALAASEWPADLENWRRGLQLPPHSPPGLPPMLFTDAVDGTLPGLIVPLPSVSTTGPALTHIEIASHFTASNARDILRTIATRGVFVRFDLDRLRDQLIAPLAAKHFGAGESSDYFVTVARRGSPGSVIFATAAPDTPLDEGHADLVTGMFDLRLDALNHPGVPGEHRPGATERLAITIVRRAPDGSGVQRALAAGRPDPGRWRVLVRHRSGSLDAVVARSRRRNLAISLGVLGLLMTSVLLTVASARRQQRLARQQMEFVASVSHELRTPLAVICSAGENLADGVVADGEQVRRYGTLVETEGRRLADMVERLMEFAGITSGTVRRAHADVDVAALVADAVKAVGHDASDRGVTVNVHANGTLPPVHGDADALRSAVQNIVGNAVKYSRDGASVEVAAEAVGSSVRIRVADCGLGIDAVDLPHIFKPFYRGRRAVDAQVRGSGVGLSVVRHVVDAHRGAVRVDSTAGMGTTVTVDLPASVPS